MLSSRSHKRRATDLLVDLELKPGTFDPVDPAKLSRELADAINTKVLGLTLGREFESNEHRRV